MKRPHALVHYFSISQAPIDSTRSRLQLEVGERRRVIGFCAALAVRSSGSTA